jgi:hydroxyacylglutathione hydrolase
MELIALPAFSDNYIWMLHDGARALVVDPGDAEAVQSALDARPLELGAILVTHHHADPVGGVDAQRPRWRGPARENIPKPYKAINGGAAVEVPGLRFEVFDVPGNTQACCTHEYTLSNLRFAHAVEPEDSNIVAYTAWYEGERAKEQPTLPSTIERERQLNPFLRREEPAMAASSNDSVAVFAALREWKNQFR